MMIALYFVAVLLLLLVLLALCLWAIGSRIPATHTAGVSVDLPRSRDQVWNLIDDVAAFPDWLPGIRKVEMLPDRDGRRVFRQQQGRNSFVLEETVKRPPDLVTRTIADDNKMFSGQWEHKFDDLGSGRTRLTVTETGTVNAAIPRAMMKHLFGYEFYLKKFAAAVKAKCGG